MRGQLAFCLVVAGCVSETPNVPTGNHPPPRVIAGGGIGDGAIDGVVNLYVIDDATRMPIPGAAVRVGALDGTTDASGLFVASGVTGVQTVIAKASSYRSELWVGVNGANVTIDLTPAVVPEPGKANLSGQITGFASLAVPAGHVKVGAVAYQQSDRAGDKANELSTFGDANVCSVTDPTAGCSYTITARAGELGLIAAILDVDPKGTSTSDDDVSRVIGWAYRGGITVTDGVNQGAVDLTLLDPQVVLSTVDLGTPPASLPKVAGALGIETPTGVYQLPLPVASPQPVPSLDALGGSGYRVSAVAQTALGDAGDQSAVIARAPERPDLAVERWMAPPTGVALTRTRLAWDQAEGAKVTSVELTQGLLPVTHLLNVAVFDGTTAVELPDAVALPDGLMSAKLTAIGAVALDVLSFSLDDDRRKLDHVASVPALVP